MGRIIDRYVLAQFATNFVICLCCLTGLYLIYDAFANLDEFGRYSEKHGGLLSLMGEYYAYRSIFFFDRMCGVVALIAAMFTVAWLRRHNELTALLAAGIPAARVFRAMLIACIGLSALAATSREVVIPALRAKLNRDPRDLMGDIGQPIRARYDNETDVLFMGKHTFANEERIEAPNFGLPPRWDHLGKQLVADNAYYQKANGEHSSGYLLRGVREPAGIAAQPSAEWNGRPVLITPRDAPWLKPDECFLVSNVAFEQLIGGRSWRVMSSTRELIASLKNPSLDVGAEVRVAIHYRMVQPLLDCTLVLLGVPLVLSREQRNIFLSLGLCIVLVGAFMIVVLCCQQMGASYMISPAAAAWLPVALFAPLAAGLADRFWG